MSRKKLPEDEKRKEFSISVNIILNDKLEIYMEKNGYSNKSKYIEKLIKEDLIKRNKINNDFE